MSLTTTLNTALGGLNFAARGAQTVSENLAGAQTDGYAVRRLAQGPHGGPVTSRHSDPILLGDRRLADGGQGYQAATSAALRDIEGTFGIAGTPGGILERLDRLGAAFTSAAASPQSDLRLAQAVTALEDVAQTLNRNSDEIQQMRTRADGDIAAQVSSLNADLSRVEILNADIARANILGRDSAGLMDQRQATVDRIAQIVPVRELPRDDGKIALLTPGGSLLLDGKAAEIGFAPTPFITAELSIEAGTLGGLTLNGRPIAMGSEAGRMSGGTLAGAFVIRDEIAPGAQAHLDTLAADLLARFQGPGVDPTQTATTPGLFTDNGAASPTPDSIGLAERISVNATVAPSTGGSVTVLRNGLNAATPAPAGDGTQLNRWSAALSDPRPTPLGPRDTAGLAGTLIARIGMDRAASEAELTYANARLDTLRQTELAQGVDTDAELQRLLVIEQAYAANARVIETAGSMIQRILEL